MVSDLQDIPALYYASVNFTPDQLKLFEDELDDLISTKKMLHKFRSEHGPEIAANHKFLRAFEKFRENLFQALQEYISFLCGRYV